MSGDEERAREVDRYLDAVLAGREGRDDPLLAALRAVPPPALPEAFTPPPAHRRLPLRATAATAAALLLAALVAVPQARAQAEELVQLVLGGVRYVRSVVAGDESRDVDAVRERALAAVRRPGRVFYLEAERTDEGEGRSVPGGTQRIWYDAAGERARVEEYAPNGRLTAVTIYADGWEYQSAQPSGVVRRRQVSLPPGYSDAGLQALSYLWPLLGFPEVEVVGRVQAEGRSVLHVRSRLEFGPDAYEVPPGTVYRMDLYLDPTSYLPVREELWAVRPGAGPDGAERLQYHVFPVARFVDPAALPADHFSPGPSAAGTAVREALAQAAALPYRTYWLGPAYPVAWQDRAGRRHDRMEPVDVKLPASPQAIPAPRRESSEPPGALEEVGTVVGYGVDVEDRLILLTQLPEDEFDATVAVRRGDQPWEREGARIEERDPAGRAGFIYAAPGRGWQEYGMVLRLDGTAVHVYVVPHTDADGRDNRNPLNSVEALRALAAALQPIPPRP